NNLRCPQSLLSVSTVSPARLRHLKRPNNNLSAAGEGGSKHNKHKPQAENYILAHFFAHSKINYK
ncbi:hypothetical protein ABLN87_12660, partial [Ruegeria sp. SCPT10]